MATPTTSAPRLDSAVRLSNGAIKVGWTNIVNAGNETYSQVHFDVRLDGRGSWAQATQVGYPTISNQEYTLYTLPPSMGGGPFNPTVSYEIAMRATGPAGPSVRGNSRTVAGEKTKAPTFTSATRTGASAVLLEFDPNPTTGAPVTGTYAYARVTGSGAVFRQVNATTSAGQTQLYVSALNGAPLDGSKSYEFELASGGPAGYSDRTSRKTVGVWWQIPAGVSDPAGAWQGTTSIRLTWTGTPTTQAPYNSQEVWRGEGPLGQLTRIATIAGSKRDYVDTTAKPAVAYRYEIVPISPAGKATSRPTVNVAAALASPTAPNAVTSVYVATDKTKTDWTPRPSPERPYVSQRLLYRLQGSTAWLVAATGLSSVATTYTHSLGGNKVAEYAVEAVNAAGSAASDPAPLVATTPARPASLTAAWTGPTTVTVSWPSASTIADQFNLEFSTDNSTWYPAPTGGALQPKAGTFPHLDVTPTVPHWYRLNATKPSITGTPASSWVTSALVAALTKPLAPTLVQPAVVDAAEAVRLGFVHNPVDGTPQTKAEVRFRVQGGPTWTTRTLTTADFTTVTAGTYTNGTVLEVQARTAGGTGEWSDWSASMLVTLRARPVVNAVTNSSPTSSTVTTTWTVTAQTSALVELLNGAGQAVEARTVTAGTRTTTWTGLIDQSTYRVRVTASDQYQQSLPKLSDEFTISLVRPGKPGVAAEFRIEDGSVLVTATPGTGVTDRMEVRRDGVKVGDIVSGMFIDYEPPLITTGVVYTVRAYGTAGGFIDSNFVAVITAACDAYLTYSGGTCRAGWEPSFTGAAGRESVAHRYVGDTNGPSFTFGPKLARTLDCAVTIHADTGDTPLGSWIDASEHPGTVTYRDPSGRVLTGAITAFRFTDSDIDEQRVSFTITQAARPIGEKAPDVMASTFDFAGMFTEGIQNG